MGFKNLARKKKNKNYNNVGPGMVVYTFNPGTREAEAGRFLQV